MNFLVLSDKYYPKPNANSICLRHILDEIKSQGHQIWIINRSVDEQVDNTNERIINFVFHKEITWQQCDNLTKKTKYLIRRIAEIPKWPRKNVKFIEEYKDCISHFSPINLIDVVVTVCNPYESVEAGVWLKRQYPTKKLVIYNIDTASDCSISKIDRWLCLSLADKAYKWEKQMFSEADLIIQFKSHRNHYMHKKYNIFHDKMLFQDVPLLRIGNNINKRYNLSGTISFLYAGLFYPGFRDPKILIDLFDNIGLGINYIVNIYTSNTFVQIINEKSITRGAIRAYNYVEEKEFVNVINATDILLSIGNRDSNMFPSKIVSYVSYRKPIIHIFQDDKDPVIEYLSNYPDKLLIDCRNDINSNQMKIFNYIHADHNPIDDQLLMNIYIESTPSFNANQIIAFLKKHTNEKHNKIDKWF